jgi:biotin carboxyl carrier protein
MKLTREFVRDGAAVAVTAEHLGGDRWRVRVGDQVREYRCEPLADGGVRLQPDGGVRLQPDGGARAFVAHAVSLGKASMVRVDGHTHTLAAPSARRGGGGRTGADGVVRAPMTGTVLDVACRAGDVVAADQTLVVVSAMKMEHKLTAGVAGTVRSVTAAKGATVAQGAELVVVEPSPPQPQEPTP